VRRSTPVTTFTGGTNWKQVFCGDTTVAAVKTDGTLWVWGDNASGISLGINTNDQLGGAPITPFGGGTNWKQVSVGGSHTAAIKTDGTLWVWGFNSSGQLGTNDTTSPRTPITTFAGGTNWKQVACAGNHTAAIKTDGSLWTWGANGSGQLGTNDTAGRTTPVTTFVGGTNWKSVACGQFHTAAIKTDGSLWVWGGNGAAQLGANISTSTNRSTPVTTFAGGTNWKSVSAGRNNTTAIKTDGTLWTWGAGNEGRLGTNDTINRSTPVTTFAGGNNWKQVSTGNDFMAAVKSGLNVDLS
jgi:alpha-tubulin suppressor-like RCC1 family protein